MLMVLSSWPWSLREFTRFIWLSAGWPPTLRPSQPTWAVSPPINGCCRPHPPSSFVIITQPGISYSFSHPTEGGRLSRPWHCRKGVQPVPKQHSFLSYFRSGRSPKGLEKLEQILQARHTFSVAQPTVQKHWRKGTRIPCWKTGWTVAQNITISLSRLFRGHRVSIYLTYIVYVSTFDQYFFVLSVLLYYHHLLFALRMVSFCIKYFCPIISRFQMLLPCSIQYVGPPC